MMQCALAVQGWGHACEVSGTTYFIYLGCFMHRAVCGLHTFEHSFAHGHSVARPNSVQNLNSSSYIG